MRRWGCKTPGAYISSSLKMGRRSSTTANQAAGQDEDPSLRSYKSADYFARTESKRKKWRTTKQILADPSSHPFVSMNAPPSCRPLTRYCDITGLMGHYEDPKSRLRYHSASVYQLVRALHPNAVQSFLSIRNAHVEL